MGKPPTQSRLVRQKTVAFAEAKDDKKKKGDAAGAKKPDDKSAADTADAKQVDGKSDAAAADSKRESEGADNAEGADRAKVDDGDKGEGRDTVADGAKAADGDTGEGKAKVADGDGGEGRDKVADRAKVADGAKVADDKAEHSSAAGDAGAKTDEPERPVVAVSSPRAHTETMAMPSAVGHGTPPALPTAAPPSAPVATGAVESPTNMPVPKNVPAGNPDDAAAPPGRVPPGDSRSLRKGGEFSLVYRMGTFVISRAGAVGKRGVWRVVEYPTSSAASHGYAKECSRFISEGFSDYRD